MRAHQGNEDEAIRVTAECLRAGGVAVVPTDTVYGVATDPAVPGAEARLFAMKRRDPAKPVPLLAAGIDVVLRRGGRLDGRALRLAQKFWPGPLTLVLDVGDGTEGFRVPDHRLMLSLLRATGGVLRVTSANISGEKPALTADEAVACLGDSVDVVLDGGMAPGGTASTVARVTGETISILREGALGRAALEAV